MKLIFFLLPLFCGSTVAQIGGFGGFRGLGSDIVKTVQTGVDNLKSQLQKVPILNNVNTFAEFTVKIDLKQTKKLTVS